MAKIARYSLVLALALASFVLCGVGDFAQDTDHLPSWNNGHATQAIIDFVDRATKSGGADFVPEAQRVAAIDIPRQAAGPRFMGLVHHTDSERECAYDRDSQIGKLDKVLDEATAKDWTVVDMKKDWARIFPAR